MKLVDEVKVLHMQNAEKGKRLAYLENRVVDPEQYARMNDIVITGLPIKPRSYARAVNASSKGEPGCELDASSTEQRVAAFLQSRGIALDINQVEGCHPLPRRNNNDKPAVILRFVNRKDKVALLKKGKMLKGTDVYFLCYATDIAKKARDMRRMNKNPEHMDKKLQNIH